MNVYNTVTKQCCDDQIKNVGGSCAGATDMRLSHGTEGIVQVLYEGNWETVCDDLFGEEEATVICRYINGNAPTNWDGNGSNMPNEFTSGHIGSVAGRPLLDNLECVGTEASLFDCVHRGIFVENCSDAEDAWVICQA